MQVNLDFAYHRKRLPLPIDGSHFSGKSQPTNTGFRFACLGKTTLKGVSRISRYEIPQAKS